MNDNDNDNDEPTTLKLAPDLLLGALAGVALSDGGSSSLHMNGPTNHAACRKKRKAKSKRKQARKSRQRNKKR